ncbi:hypothetical protein Peur_020121 [Populus x canadensis]
MGVAGVYRKKNLCHADPKSKAQSGPCVAEGKGEQIRPGICKALSRWLHDGNEGPLKLKETGLCLPRHCWLSATTPGPRLLSSREHLGTNSYHAIKEAGKHAPREKYKETIMEPKLSSGPKTERPKLRGVKEKLK